MMSVNDPPGDDSSEYPLVTLVEVPEGSEFSMELMVALENLLGTTAEELPRLTESIDPDVLDRLYHDPESPFEGQVSFKYAGKTVVVFGATKPEAAARGQSVHVFVAIKDRP